MIENAVEFLCEKYEELAAGSAGIAANKLLRSSRERPDQTLQSTTATCLATSYRQPTLLLTSAETTFNRPRTETSQSPDETHLKPVLTRITVIEEALCSFRSNAENFAERLSQSDKQLTELLSNISESNKKHNLTFRKVKEQISEINETQVALDQEQETRLQSLETQLQKLSTSQDRMKVEMESQAELTEKLVHVHDQLESVKENLDVLDARIGRIMDDCSNRHQDTEHATRDLAEKVTANTENALGISERQVKIRTLFRELETRMQTLQADSRRNVEDVQKQTEKGGANFRILCQMLNDRLTPLEQLRSCLNERASTREENIRQLAQVIQEVAAISPRLQQLEFKSSRTRCGFTARAWLSGQVARDTVRPYTALHTNVGGNFNADSGIFTAPVDGLYVASISVWLNENESLEIGVNYNKQGLSRGLGTLVCWSSAEVKGTHACNVGVVYMKAGDTLLSYVYRNNTTATVNYVYLSCFQLA